MNPQDLLIVARRFWPHSGLTEVALSDLARQLKFAGHHVTVATVQWSRQWCENFCFHGIPIVRFAKPVTGPWSSFRYARALAKHFAIKSYDGIITSGLGDESLGVIRAAPESTPVVVRVDDGLDGVTGNLHRKHVEVCLSADAVAATSRPLTQLLCELPEMPNVHTVLDGFRSHSVDHRRDTQTQARRALSDAHPVLKIEPEQPLVISYTRMNGNSGLCELVNAWPDVLTRFPTAKLWVIGDGQEAGQIWQSILQLDLAHCAMMPGFFDDIDHLMSAGDLYVHPRRHAEADYGLLRAMFAGMPSVAIDNSWTRSVLDSPTSGQLVRATGSSALAQSIIAGLSQSDWRLTTGRNAVQTITQNFSADQQVQGYLKLLSPPSRQIVETAK